MDSQQGCGKNRATTATAVCLEPTGSTKKKSGVFVAPLPELYEPEPGVEAGRTHRLTRKNFAMSMLTNLDLIRRVPLFSTLSDRHAETIAQAVVKKRFKRGEAIVEQGKKTNSLYIILAGRARVMTTDRRGREVILATLSQGDCIGEMSLIDSKPHSATVQADVQTDALVLSRADFATCMPEYSSLAHAVLQGVVKRLREADQKIESLALMDVYGRVARALVEAAQPDRDGNLVIRDRISRQDVAKMVGASREMVSRVMKDLEGRGFVELQPNGSTIVKERLTTLT